MTGCIRPDLFGNFVIVGADGGCSLSLALRVDFVQLCTYRMHIELSFLASSGFWMFAITRTISATISAFQGLAGLSKKRRWLQVMGRGGAIWG